MTVNNHEQIIKCHDDHIPVRLGIADTATDSAEKFKLLEGTSCSWASTDQLFGPEKLRSRIEPWLTALVQSEHLSLLIGSGLTHAVHGMATHRTLPGMKTVTFGNLNDAITAEAKRTSIATGRQDGNFEDQIRAASELLRGLEIIEAGDLEDDADEKKAPALRVVLQTALNDFAKSILAGERNLVEAPIEKREQAFNYLVSFLMSFASRTGTRERLQLFTTNYDRYIEAGADAAGLRLIDRFVGTLAPVFRASRLDVDLHYNPPGIRGEPRYLEGVARFTKLHGSVDWVESERTIRRIGLPFGVEDPAPFLAAPGLGGADALRLMIYPNAAKDRETASYPYVELFRDFAAATCRPNSTLICYGYSFGDEHINRVIEDALTIPSAHLVVIARNDPLGRIMAAYEKLGRHAQVTLLIGDHLGDLKTLVDHYLPKPAIDRTTFRMAELLKARWGTSQAANASVTPPPAADGVTEL
jgi:SIR2-like domain